MIQNIHSTHKDIKVIAKLINQCLPDRKIGGIIGPAYGTSKYHIVIMPRKDVNKLHMGNQTYAEMPYGLC